MLLLMILIGASTTAILWYLWSSNLPYIGALKEYNPPIITEIYSDDGYVIGRFWKEKRIVITLDDVPDHLINAFIAAEDSRFFQHEGVDFGVALFPVSIEYFQIQFHVGLSHVVGDIVGGLGKDVGAFLRR